MESLGLSNAISQQEGLTNEARNENEFLQQENNRAIATYHQKVSSLKQADTSEDSKNLGEISSQVADGVAKAKEYRDALKSGEWKGTIDNLQSGAKKVASGVKRVAGAVSDSLPSAPPKPSVDGIEVSGTEMTGEMPPAQPEQPAEPPSEPQAPQTEGEGSGEQNTAGEGEGATPESTAGSTAESTAESTAGETAESTAGETGGFLKSAGGVAMEGASRVFGGAMGGAMLGDDIYNQVSQGKFFTGENTGDKIGHFANEIGSALDVGGAVTADPFLMALGVGVGAVGSVVSDISELFGHKKKEQEVQKEAPKPQIENVVAPVNIAGQGQIAQSSSSTIQSVSAGGS